MYRNPLPPGAPGTSAKPKEASRTLLPPRVLHYAVSEGPRPGADRGRCSLLVSIVLSHPFPRHNDRIGRSPGVAVSKTGPAAGTARIDAAEEKELLQTLLGAQVCHVGAMFDQFVQFRESISRIQAEI